MKQIVSSFSLGLFLATVILGTIYMIEDNDSGTVSDDTNLSQEEMVEQLESAGFSIVQEEDYENISKEITDLKMEINELKSEYSDLEAEYDQLVDEGSDSSENSEDNQEDSNAEETSGFDYSISIESGMSSGEIANQLADAGIIESSVEFNRFLESEGYSTRIQLGEFTVHSEMSYVEIANALTN